MLRRLGWMAVFALILKADSAEQILRQKLKLAPKEIDLVKAGRAVSREIATPERAELLVYGAIFVKGKPESFLRQYAEVEKMVDGASFLAAKRFGQPPNLADVSGLNLPKQDLEALRDCTLGNCEVQLPEADIQRFRGSVPWNQAEAPNIANAMLRQLAVDAVARYRKQGIEGIGVLRDKAQPVRVRQVFERVLSRVVDLPAHDPEFQQYLLNYPAGARPSQVHEFFYWETVKFGLKPTIRVNHVLMRQNPARPSAWMVANKQIYATHYFQTALDLWFCVPAQNGYYLATVKVSRQDGFEGLKGRLVRSVVVSKTLQSMREGLERLKFRLEGGR